MSSFKRKVDTTSQKLPSGARCSPASSKIILTSSGISSLDDILGGGLQLGTSSLILCPDVHSLHCELVHKYFIAQGLSTAQNTIVYDPFAQELVKTCMWMTGDTGRTQDEDEESGADQQDKVKIAWRYERLQKFKTTVSSKSLDEDGYCRPFDLTTRIPPNILENCKGEGMLNVVDNLFDGEGDTYEAVIKNLEETLDKRYQTSQCVTRVSFPMLGSPYWGVDNPEKLVSFLLQLRQILHSRPLVTALISLPAHMCVDSWSDEGWIEKLSWVTDASLTLNSFSADPSSTLMIPKHHGLVKINRLPCVNSLVPSSDKHSILRGLSASASAAGGVSENNLAFKCTRKRFVIETFHLDVEGGVGERRTAPSATAMAFQESFDTGQQSHHANQSIFGKAEATIAVEVDPPSRTEEAKPPKTNATPKKPRKRVGFQVEQPNLYDF